MPRYFRKVLKITAEDSPNVRLARQQLALGLNPTNEIVIPGVLPWDEYQKRLALWDEVRQAIGLRAVFWEGADLLLWPPQWLDRAEKLHRAYELLRAQGQIYRVPKAMGIDPAEGGDKSTWALGDEFGLIDLVSKPTPNTTAVPNTTIALIKEYGLDPQRVCFDRGGGGKQAADTVRDKGYDVRTVAFGEAVAPPPQRGVTGFDEKVDQYEEKYEYVNRRCQMYGEASLLFDPAKTGEEWYWRRVAGLGEEGYPRPGWGYALPPDQKFAELRRQMSMIPRYYDPEGRLFIPPKQRRPGQKATVQSMKTLTEIIGHSPDEADAFVLLVHAILHKSRVVTAGAAI